MITKLHIRFESMSSKLACVTAVLVMCMLSLPCQAAGHYCASSRDAKLAPSDLGLGDNFGGSNAVALDGGTCVVGAPSHDHSSIANAGAAYVLELQADGSWMQVKKLIAPSPQANEAFGSSVAIHGNTVVVGAKGGGPPLYPAAGSVFIFERDLGGLDNWGYRTEIFADDLEQCFSFGAAVAVEDNTLAVGAAGWMLFANPGPLDKPHGKGYVFQRDEGGANNWGQVASMTLVLEDEEEVPGGFPHPEYDGDPDVVRRQDPKFGESVSLSGDTLVFGAWGYHDLALTSSDKNNAGALFVYERNLGGLNAWGRVKRITPTAPRRGMQFAKSLSVGGDTLAVGAPQYALPSESVMNDRGAVFVFERDLGGAESWGERTIIVPNDHDLNDSFGRSVAMGEDALIVGADQDIPNDIPNPNIGRGAVYLFKRDVGGPEQWGQYEKLPTPPGDMPDTLGRLGISVSIDGDRFVAGAHRWWTPSTLETGTAFVYTLYCCEGDVDCDGMVTVNDTSFVKFRLGNSGVPGTIEGDADGSGTVDAADISYVIFRFGPCP